MPKPEVPTDRLTVIDSRYIPPSIGRSVDVDLVHNIVRNAEGGDTRDLFCLYRDLILSDAHTQGEISKRKLAVIGDLMTFQPQNKTVPADVLASERIDDMVSNCRAWRLGCSALLDGCLYPVSVVEKVFAPSSGGLRFKLVELVPVPHYLLDFTSGAMRIFDVDPVSGMVLSTSHDPDPNRYMVHRGHLLTTPDNWGGPLRSILFWWLLSAMDREWWARFLDRYGSPFLVGKYAPGDTESRGVLERAFSMAVKIGGLVVTDQTAVEIKEAAAASTGEAYDKFLTICQREKSKLIIGQTLSSEAQATGMNSGVSNQHEAVRQDIRKLDATLLSETLRQQLVQQFMDINGLAGEAPEIVWGSDSVEEIASTTGLLESLGKSGIELDDSGLATLSERVGLPLRRRSGGPLIPAFSADARPAAGEGSHPRPFSASILPAFRSRR
jgi:phage gp29-like protein